MTLDKFAFHIRKIQLRSHDITSWITPNKIISSKISAVLFSEVVWGTSCSDMLPVFILFIKPCSWNFMHIAIETFYFFLFFFWWIFLLIGNVMLYLLLWMDSMLCWNEARRSDFISAMLTIGCWTIHISLWMQWTNGHQLNSMLRKCTLKPFLCAGEIEVIKIRNKIYIGFYLISKCYMDA